ncbi:MAG: hypothetical protein ABRQ37_05100, partial [Candidatus Eremiobacterota bacterium]
ALTKLNTRPSWGMWDIDKVTPSASDDTPNTDDNIKLKLKGATAYIRFTGNKYNSYNNLKGQTPVDRAKVGDTKLTGTIPAYTAEIICIGKAGNEDGDGAEKYLRVVFIRNDIYPYPINSDGQIDFASAGDINIYGNSSSSPGNMHSNWYSDTTDEKDPNYYSIISETGSGNVSLQGGVASAAAHIKLNRLHEEDVVIASNPEGKEEFENIDINEVLKEAKTNTIKKVEPGTFMVTPRYYISNNPDGAVDAYGNDLNHVNALVKGIEARAWETGDGSNNILTINKQSGALFGLADQYSTESGCPPTSEQIQNWQKDYSSEKGWSVSINCKSALPGQENSWINLKEVKGTNALHDGNGKFLGWDRVEAKTYEVSFPWEATATGPDPNTGGQQTIKLGGNTWNHTGPTSELGGDFSFTLTKENNWGNKPPPGNVINSTEYVWGLAKLDPDGNLDKLVLPGTNGTNTDLGMNVTFNQAGNTVEGDLSLAEDIYVGKDETSMPGSEDYTIPLKYLAYNPSDPSYKKPQPNVFCISGEQFSVLYGEPPKSLNDIYKDLPVEEEDITAKLTLDLNKKNLYSDSHVAIGAEVKGEGSLVSRGKMGYIYGMQSSEVVAIAGDDLILSTNNKSKIDCRGVLYSDDDTWLIPLNNSSSPLGSSSYVTEYKLNEEIADGSNKLKFTAYTPDPPVSPAPDSINVSSVKTETGKKYYFQNVKLDYNGHSVDFTNYRVAVEYDGTSYNTKMYQYNKSTSSWNEVKPLPAGYDQGELNDIGTIIGTNASVSKGDIKITGNLVGLNCNGNRPSDDGGNSSIHTEGQGKVFFYYDMIDIGKLALLRGDKFTVRRASWCELN